mmetsp:Transcript_120832/g.188748  ORF Transcript_120832/g.188748 Transcript_120832/m.188748 type:complete len:476 (+) Transcript_120832:75-1502(+)
MLPPSLGGAGPASKRPPTVPMRSAPMNTTIPSAAEAALYRDRVEALEEDHLLEAYQRYTPELARPMDNGRMSAEAAAFRNIPPAVSSNMPPKAPMMGMPFEMRQPMTMPSELPDNSSLVFGAERFDTMMGASSASAVAAYSRYSMELKTWVDQQVDAHLNQFFQSFDSDVLQSRKESAAALSICERLEERILAVSDSQARHRNKLENIEQEVGALKTQMAAFKINSSAMWERDNNSLALNLDSLQKCCDKHEADLIELGRRLLDSTDMMQRLSSDVAPRRDIEALSAMVRQVEKDGKALLEDRVNDLHGKLSRLAELCPQLGLKLDALGGAHTSIEERLIKIEAIDGLAGLRGEVESYGKQIADHITESKREEALREEYLQAKMAEDLATLQQRLLATMRAEMTAAFRSEAAAVTALDEQLWQLKDQQLRQQVDKVANQRAKERIAVLDRADARNQHLLGTPNGHFFGHGDISRS